MALVGAHPQLAERMAAELIRRRALAGVLGPYERVETQRTFGATRVDFVLHMADGSRWGVENTPLPRTCNWVYLSSYTRR